MSNESTPSAPHCKTCNKIDPTLPSFGGDNCDDCERIYSELVAAIEEAVPAAGFWKKDKPIDFSVEDILYALDEKYPEKFAYQPTLGLIEFFAKTIPINKRDYIRNAVYFRFGESLSWYRDNAPETITFLHSLLVQ